MTRKKKSTLEILDAMLVSDIRDIKHGFEKADQMLADDVNEIAKRWGMGRPIIYNDEYHKRERERMKRLRSSK